jgi:hypothetical protein
MNFTHTYRNHFAREVQCFITDNPDKVAKLLKRSEDFNVIVENEKGEDVILKYSKLKKI